eukprot:7390737-Prymnesium_polylepis.2
MDTFPLGHPVRLPPSRQLGHGAPPLSGDERLAERLVEPLGKALCAHTLCLLQRRQRRLAPLGLDQLLKCGSHIDNDTNSREQPTQEH